MSTPITPQTTAPKAPECPPATKRLWDWFWPIVLVSVVILGGLGAFVLNYAWDRASEGHAFQKDFLVNVAAGFVGMALGTFVAAVIGLMLAKNKLRQVSKPVLALIQQLRIDGKISDNGARRAVVCAVTLLSEGSINGRLDPGSSEPGTKCPICTLDIPGGVRCIHCRLSKSVWSDKELVAAHDRAELLKR